MPAGSFLQNVEKGWYFFVKNADNSNDKDNLNDKGDSK